jgi:hypothetical protein
MDKKEYKRNWYHKNKDRIREKNKTRKNLRRLWNIEYWKKNKGSITEYRKRCRHRRWATLSLHGHRRSGFEVLISIDDFRNLG